MQRAEACLARAQRLNPMVEIKCDTEAVMKKSREYFEQFDVVILTECVMDVMVRQLALKRFILFDVKILPFVGGDSVALCHFQSELFSY